MKSQQDRRIDENSVSLSVTDYSLRKPYFAISPSPTATTESQMSSDASSSGINLVDDRSIGSSARPISLLTKRIKTGPFKSPTNSPFASPELRDQMKYYMKKHITPTNKANNNSIMTPTHMQQTPPPAAAAATQAQQ